MLKTIALIYILIAFINYIAIYKTAWKYTAEAAKNNGVEFPKILSILFVFIPNKMMINCLLPHVWAISTLSLIGNIFSTEEFDAEMKNYSDNTFKTLDKENKL